MLGYDKSVCLRVAADTRDAEHSLHESAGRRQHVAPQYLERRRARRKSIGFVSGTSMFTGKNLAKRYIVVLSRQRFQDGITGGRCCSRQTDH